MNPNHLQLFDICTFETVHPLSEEELETRCLLQAPGTRGSYVDNAHNTESVLGVTKEEAETGPPPAGERSPGMIKIIRMSKGPAQTVKEHIQHHENTLRTGLESKIQGQYFAGPHLGPVVTTGVFCLDLERKAIVCKCCVMKLDEMSATLIRAPREPQQQVPGKGCAQQ